MKRQKTIGGRRAAFTLIELLTVIAILSILVAMTIGIIGYAQSKASESKTEIGISVIEAGLEKYYNEYGEYPTPVENTGAGTGGAVTIYQALCDDGDDAIEGGDGRPSTNKVGKRFMVNLVTEGYVGEDNGKRFAQDGFGRPYFYRIYDKDFPDATRQDTYDLWSTGDDKTLQDEVKWITNW